MDEVQRRLFETGIKNKILLDLLLSKGMSEKVIHNLYGLFPPKVNGYYTGLANLDKGLREQLEAQIREQMRNEEFSLDEYAKECLTQWENHQTRKRISSNPYDRKHKKETDKEK